MPLLSDYALREEWEEMCWRKIRSSEKLLKLLITSHERRDLVMRAVILDRLAAGKSYKEIVRELSISPQTVSGVKKSLLEERKYKSYTKNKRREGNARNLRQNQKKKSCGISRRTKYGITRIL